MGKRKMIKIKQLGPQGHSTSLVPISEAYEVLSTAISRGKFIYVEPRNYIIDNTHTLRGDLSQIECAVIIPRVAGG
jgi:hypothetical protein